MEGRLNVPALESNLSWSQNLEADCPVVPPLSKPCSVPVLPCCHGVMALGVVPQCGATVRYDGCHNPPP